METFYLYVQIPSLNALNRDWEFLEKNGMLFVEGEKIIEDYTLVAITIMIAESNPDEKDIMVKLVMNFINK